MHSAAFSASVFKKRHKYLEKVKKGAKFVLTRGGCVVNGAAKMQQKANNVVDFCSQTGEGYCADQKVRSGVTSKQKSNIKCSI